MDDRINIVAGHALLPADPTKRAELLEFADAHHVLGQMAHFHLEKASDKTAEVLENGLFRANFDHQMLRFEMDRLQRALIGTGITPVILKGGAYVATGSNAGKGRRVSDLDIMVGREQIAETEALLKNAGWEFEAGVDNLYDINYYRKYMHELPPLRHKSRRTLIDVHHGLVPQTASYSFKSDLMLQSAEFIPGTRLKVFTPVDRFIHSAIHSFADGSFDTPSRSVLELHLLLQDLTAPEKSALVARAVQLGAAKPVATALYLLGQALDDTAAKDLRASLGGKAVVDVPIWAFKQKLLRPEKARAAKLVLFLRSHLIRMPVYLLIIHSLRKFLKFSRRLLSRKPG